MPEEEITLNLEQLAVLDLYAAIRNLERSDIAESLVIPAVVQASKPGECD